MSNEPIPSQVFVDTGGFYALSDPRDDDHQAARRIQTQLADTRSRLFTSNFIIDEAYTLHLVRANYHAAIAFLDSVTASPLTIVRITPDDELRAQELLRTFSDKRYSYTDATSFAVMDRLNLTHAFTFDHNFEQYGKIL